MFNLYYSNSNDGISGSVNYDTYKNIKISKNNKANKIQFTIDEIDVLSISYNDVDKLLDEVINDENLVFEWYKFIISANFLRKDISKNCIDLGFNNIKAIIDKNIVSSEEIIDYIYKLGILFFNKRIARLQQNNCDGFLLMGNDCIKEFIVLALLAKIAVKANIKS